MVDRRLQSYDEHLLSDTDVSVADPVSRPTRNRPVPHAVQDPLLEQRLPPATSENNIVNGRDLDGRRFLIVTAPFGPFGRVLAETLSARGAEVSRMIFNFGDMFYWRRSGGITFKGEVRHWPARVVELAPAFTDIIVFGEGGPYNQAVLSRQDTLSSRVWVLENGYFRPDWITVELGGVNASSRLPRSREGYDDADVVVKEPRHVGRILPHHVINISIYHSLEWLFTVLYPNYVQPYTHAPLVQCIGHIKRYVGLALRPPKACDTDRIATRGDFYLVCLQREGDAQLLRYSHFADNVAFMAEVMSSFARYAAQGTRLVVKNHPLDPGLVDLAHMTRCLAVERGLAERVDFIDGGNLAQLCRASRGMVVNNSSAALSALGFHTPVKVLGEAFFDFDGLTDGQSIDGFWINPTPPDPDLFTRFRARVIALTQVNGNYHEPRSMRPTAEGVGDVFAGIATCGKSAAS